MAGMGGMPATDPAAGDAYEDELAQHYADRFDDEGRGKPARFGYTFDHPVGGGRAAPPPGTALGGGKKAGGGKRKRLWGRK
jgi:hypothetical protein